MNCKEASWKHVSIFLQQQKIKKNKLSFYPFLFFYTHEGKEVEYKW